MNLTIIIIAIATLSYILQYFNLLIIYYFYNQFIDFSARNFTFKDLGIFQLTECNKNSIEQNSKSSTSCVAEAIDYPHINCSIFQA